jgi:hypothetical protein
MVPNDKQNVNMDKIKLKRVNRTHPHLMMGEIEIFVDVGNDVEIVAEFFKQQGYEYRPTAYKMKSQFCDFFQTEKVFSPQFLKDTDFPLPEACPLPKGIYHIFNHSPDIASLPPIFESGEYMAQFKLMKGEKLLQGMKIYVTVVNKVNVPYEIGK